MKYLSIITLLAIAACAGHSHTDPASPVGDTIETTVTRTGNAFQIKRLGGHIVADSVKLDSALTKDILRMSPKSMILECLKGEGVKVVDTAGTGNRSISPERLRRKRRKGNWPSLDTLYIGPGHPQPTNAHYHHVNTVIIGQ